MRIVNELEAAILAGDDPIRVFDYIVKRVKREAGID